MMIIKIIIIIIILKIRIVTLLVLKKEKMLCTWLLFLNISLWLKMLVN